MGKGYIDDPTEEDGFYGVFTVGSDEPLKYNLRRLDFYAKQGKTFNDLTAEELYDVTLPQYR